METLALNNVPDPDAKFDALYDALGKAARARKSQMRAHGRRLPGVAEAIREFARGYVVQSVVTGNIHSIATTKLEAFGLLEGLDVVVGGYGDDGADRAVLVRLAIERAGAVYGLDFQPKRTVVIGDTPHDIRGAHDANARAIGVATGGSGLTELSTAGADIVFPDLADTAAVCAAVFGTLLGDD